jgi:hypothetical protein
MTPVAGIDDTVHYHAPIASTASTNWSHPWTQPTAAASPYTAAAAANPYLGSSTSGDALDPARTRRLLERAKRDYDFVRWLSDPGADARRAGAPTTGIDDAVDQPAPFNRPAASSPSRLPLSAARKAEGVPTESSYLSIVSPHGAILAPRMINVAGGAGPANAPEGPDLVSLAEHGMLPRLLSLLPTLPAPAASLEGEPKLTNKASWDPRTWSAYDNPLAWLHLDYERKFPTEAARLKRMPMGGDVPAFNAPNAARRMGEAFATGYGEQPIIPTQDPGSITNAGPVTIPEWARLHIIALMRAGNSLPQALDQVLRAGRGVIAMVPAAGAGAAQDLGIADQQGADKLQGELGIFTQFPGEPGAPSLAAAPWVVPETVGHRVLRRAEERLRTSPPANTPAAPRQAATTGEPLRLPVEIPELNVGPSHIADFRARHNVPTTDTIGVGRTNVRGLEDVTIEGASPAVRQEAELPPTTPGDIKSPSKLARDQKHAEEDLFNQFIQKVRERGLRSSDLEGKLVIYVSNPKGVCTVCRWGLDNPDAPAGIIKQFSELHPKLTIEFTVATQPGIRSIGPSRFTVRNGEYISRSDR